MPALIRQLNYRRIILGESTECENVGVRRKDGSHDYLGWLGWLGRPIKLQVIRATDLNHQPTCFASCA